MQTGTIFLLGKASAIRPNDDTEVVVEMLAVDTDTDYDDYVKIDGEIVEQGKVPKWAMDAYRHAFTYRHQIDKEVAHKWLAN